jgi:proteasome accessory factor B
MKKAERLLDLIVFLLNARRPVQFVEMQNEFPEEYGEGEDEAIARKFERDKADIIALGLPLKYVSDEEDDTGGYIIDRESYALSSINLGPEELAVLYLAGSAVMDMESSPFNRDLVLALNKIAFAAGDSLDGKHAAPRVLPANRLEQPAALRRKEYLQTLRQAIAARKSVILFYHSLWQDQKTKRNVDPYGLACTRGTWFLVGHCQLRDAIRVFHLDRITGLEVNRFKPKTPDFEFPKDFKLSDYIARNPWNLRVHEPVEAIIRIEPPVADSVADELGLRPEEVEKDGPARILRLTATFLDGLLPTILWYRSLARVQTPPELVSMTRSALERLAGEAP